MKLKILFITLISLLLINPVLAAEKMTQKDMSVQQRKMGSCNSKASEQSLTGEKRKSFMQSFLRNKKNQQNERMKNCSKKANKMKFKKDERQEFIQKCLSNKNN
ncbi:MAG: PsiF family protein [Candidatus Arsenophonus phytopathogenicus]